MSRIVVLGSLNMDLVVTVPRLPAAGEPVVGGSLRTTPGGKGANQAVAAARLGGGVDMVGRVGRDDFGATLRDGLVGDGVDVGALRDDDAEPSGTALIVVDERGENQIAVAPGANGRVDERDVDRALDRLGEGDVLLAQLEIPLGAVAAAMRGARERGARTVLNAAPARPLPPEVLRELDVLLVNEHEAAVLADGASDAGAALLAMGPRAVVVTLGGDGSLLHTAGGLRRAPAPRIQVVDTTAAGDAFAGALAHWLSTGHPLEDALPYANAAGAHAAAHPGAQASLPTAEDVPPPG